LVTLLLNENALTGGLPINIGRLHSLRTFSLAHNHMAGHLPLQIGDMSELEDFDLSYNGFSGHLFPIRTLKKLDYLNASHDAFGGELPFDVCQGTLTGLDLSNNHFQGELHDIGKCKFLRTLNLSHNDIHGELRPGAIGIMTDLEELDLSNNHFYGDLPSWLGNLRRLSYIDLSNNEFMGSLSSVNWLRINVLKIDHNHLSGSIPSQLFSGSLEELSLSNNELSGALPRELCASSTIQLLDLSHNLLTGSICNSTSDLDEINTLNLSYNRLSGTLPASISSLTTLTRLFVAHNDLSGQLPVDANLPALQLLDISFNQLTGALPSWVGRLPHLTAANLSNNAFTGGISELAKVKSLRVVDLRFNPWKEPLPVELTKLQNASISIETMSVIDPKYLLPRKPAEKTVRETSPPPSKPSRAPRVITRVVPTPGDSQSVLSGTVRGADGAAIRNATVVAESNFLKRRGATDDAGRYLFFLPVGDYRLTIEGAGFANLVIEKVSVQAAAARVVDVTFDISATPFAIGIGQGPVTGLADLGPWWNSWITRRGSPEESKETVLEPNQRYSFYVELSGVPKRDQDNGDLFADIARPLREHLSRLVAAGNTDTSFLVRISVIGRAAVLSDSISSTAEWSSLQGWQLHNGATASAVLNVELARLFPKVPPRSSGYSTADLLAARGGAVRFSVNTLSPGCAAIAVSIWDQTQTIPLDHLVRMVRVGRQPACTGDFNEQEVVPTLYADLSQGVLPDVSLHVFEFSMAGRMHSASFMVLSKPMAPCASYSWNSEATITEQILNSSDFKDALDHARNSDHYFDGVYSSVGERISDTVFPSRQHGTCGSAEAFDALKSLAHERDVRMFARVSDESGRLAIVPLGLLAMLERGGQRVFPHDIHLFQPIARQTLSDTDCVSSWTFMLPSQLEGVGSSILVPPDSVSTDSRVVRSREAFVNRFIELGTDSDTPTGLILLAHHEDGVLRFSGPADFLAFTRFERDLGQGSIAILSACETANLSGSTKLVTRLNEKGVDSIVAASFELPVVFGAKFSFNFADVIERSGNQQLTVEEAFTKAMSATLLDLSATTGDRARGMSLELVIAGNPKLRICASNGLSHH
jgi:Leucine-rich repeat (LRR) protein